MIAVLLLAALQLAPDEVARVGETTITFADLDNYLGRSYARRAEGGDALQQLLVERLVDDAATALQLVVTDTDVDTAIGRLDAEARAASAGEVGIEESLADGVDTSQLRDGIRRMLLLEGLVRSEHGLTDGAAVDTALMDGWIVARTAAAGLRELPLEDARAGSYSGGEITRREVGARLRAVLPSDDVTGVVTEMLGIELVARRAEELGLRLTAEEITREIDERQAQLDEQAPGTGITYAQVVEQVEGVSLAELMNTDAFATEVLLRMIAEREVADYGEMDAPLQRVARQRTYTALFADAGVERRL